MRILCAVGPHVSAWLRAQRDVAAEERQEGQDAWTIHQWRAHHQKGYKQKVNRRDAHALTAIDEALKKDAMPPDYDDGEIYTHTLRDADEPSEEEISEAHIAEIRRQLQRALLLDSSARAVLREQLEPLITPQIFDGGRTPNQSERAEIFALLAAYPSPANNRELARWYYRYTWTTTLPPLDELTDADRLEPPDDE